MPADKGKVLTAIEVILKGKSATKNFKDSIATKWAAKIETDEDIEAYVTDRSDILLEASTEADRRATQASTKAKTDAQAAIEGKKPETQDDTTPAALPDDTPAYIKAMMKQMEGLVGTVTKLQKEKATETITQRFKQHEKLKGIPDALLKGYFPGEDVNDEQFEASVESAHAALKPFVEKLNLSEFGKDTPPGGGSTGGGNVSGKPAPAMVAYAEKQAKEFEAKQSTIKN